MKVVINNIEKFLDVAVSSDMKLMGRDSESCLNNNLKGINNIKRLKEDIESGLFWYDDGVKEKVLFEYDDIEKLFFENAIIRNKINGFQFRILMMCPQEDNITTIRTLDDGHTWISIETFLEIYREYSIDRGKTWHPMTKDAE